MRALTFLSKVYWETLTLLKEGQRFEKAGVTK